MDEEVGGFFSIYKWHVMLLILALIAVGVAVYFTFIQPVKCDTFACFQENMATCTKATYVNEEPEASWRYTITGKGDGECNIDVVLLQAKKGELELENLAGYEMECSYPVGIVNYPDNDLGACSGKLKEELQGIIIKKLYSYILDNLGSLDDSLKQIV